jgi:hypothetical protein
MQRRLFTKLKRRAQRDWTHEVRLSGGRFAGKCIYVAEHIGSILTPGTQFNAGDTLATAYPGPY